MRRCVVGLLLMFPLGLFGQSTSPWQKIGNASFGDTDTPSPGAAYMTVYVRAATVYQKSNWWTNFVEKNRQAVLTINLNGTVAGTNVAQTKVGDPIELRRNDSMVDLGYSGIVVDHLPTTFSGMTLTIQINKTAKDGLNDIISMVSDLSKTQPPTLSVSQQAMGITNLSKTLADFLFNKNLLVKKVSTQSPIPSNGMLGSGIYACFAGDSNVDYAQYLSAGRGDLSWSGTQLIYKNKPVTTVSYFIVEIGYQKRFFAQPTDALSFGVVKPWAALYLLAQSEVPTVNSQSDVQKIHDQIQSHLSNARALLNADSDFIADERSAIASAVHDVIQRDFRARLDTLGISQGGALGQENGSTQDLFTFTEDVDASSTSFLKKQETGNRPMVPTVSVPQ
jgi:hypothetical protein